jgi:two-component system NtrC family sensor kinase
MAEVFLLRWWGASPWWLLVVPLTFALVAIVVEGRRLRGRLAEVARQRDEAAAQLDRRISELFSLRELGYVVSESLELTHIVQQVARYATRFLQAGGAIVVLQEPAGDALEVLAAEGTLSELMGRRSDGRGSLVGTSIERGRIEVAQAMPGRQFPVFAGATAASVAVVPLRLRGERIGAIAVTDRSGGPFTTEDLWLLSTVATNASVALANSRLFAIVERGRREWETAFNALHEGLAVIGPEGRIQRANSSLARLAGVPEPELIGRDFQALLFGDAESPAALLASARRGESPAPGVVRIAPDRFLRLTVSPLAGAPRAVVALVEDVTEQQALEAQLFQNEKMAAIGQLVSGVAHELNNPLTSIAGLTELLLERGPGGDATRQHLRVIHDQADRAGRIVRNLLTFVRKGTPEPEPFDLNEVVMGTSLLIAYEVRLRDVELDTRPSKEPVMVVGDRNELQQVIVNLVTNAVQALAGLPAGRRRAITLETACDGDHARVVVRDTGDGVPAEHVPNLFTPFFTTKPAGQGTGLGLSLSYGLVQAHAGTLTYAPAPGGGAEFTVTLPRAMVPAPAQRGPSRSVLLVGDDAQAQRVLGALFAPDGLAVDTARTGDQALALAGRRDYALVVADAGIAVSAGEPFVRALLRADAKWEGRLITIGGRSAADGPHRVSRPFDLRRLRALADRLMADAAGVSTPPREPAATDRA